MVCSNCAASFLTCRRWFARESGCGQGCFQPFQKMSKILRGVWLCYIYILFSPVSSLFELHVLRCPTLSHNPCKSQFRRPWHHQLFKWSELKCPWEIPQGGLLVRFLDQERIRCLMAYVSCSGRTLRYLKHLVEPCRREKGPLNSTSIQQSKLQFLLLPIARLIQYQVHTLQLSPQTCQRGRCFGYQSLSSNCRSPLLHDGTLCKAIAAHSSVNYWVCIRRLLARVISNFWPLFYKYSCPRAK